MSKKLLALVALVATMGLMSAAAGETKTTRGPESVVRRNDAPTTNYTNVGGNHRRSPIKDWADAIDYMDPGKDPRNPRPESEGYWYDVHNLLIQGVPASFRPMYSGRMVPELRRIIRLAADSGYMRGRRPDRAIEQELRDKFDCMPIEPGTPLNAVSEGERDRKVRLNRIFLGTDAQYNAYRVLVEVPIKHFASEDDRKTATVYARVYFYLIVRCGNTALGQVRVYEVDTIKVSPPTTHVEYRPVPVNVSAEAQARAEAAAEATARSESRSESTATGGNATINNYAAKAELEYHRPDASTYDTQVIKAGGITAQAVPVINAKAIATARQYQQQQQEQMQQQWQQQMLDLWQQIINENINNNSVGVTVNH